MNVIYKYELDVIDRQAIEIHKGAQILDVQVQNGKPFMWALVDPKNEKEYMDISTVGTGNPTSIGLANPYIATYQLMEGNLVFHVFQIL